MTRPDRAYQGATGAVLELLAQARDQWLTLEDIAIWTRGDDLPFDLHAARQHIYLLRRRGYRIETRRFPQPPATKQWTFGYRLVSAVADMERVA